MNIDWSAYKITILLYFGVLLLPISFYFTYSSFSEINSDTKVLNSFTLNSASILTIDNIVEPLQKQKIIKKIDTTFQKLRPWMLENDREMFYVGTEPLLKKYDSLLKLWNSSKNSDKKALYICYKEAKTVIFSLNNMLKLKQNRVYNIFYINLFVAMGLLLTLIFFTRAYIYQQLSKHAIYDFKTKLFTKDYLLATLKEVSAQMRRNKEPLSALYISVEDLKVDRKTLQKKRDEILEYVGASLLNSLRVSDVACRYSESEFIVILPNTQSKNIQTLLSRIDENLSKISYTIKVAQNKQDETYDDFLAQLIKN